MKRTKLISFLMLSVLVIQAQELAHSYYYTDGYSIIPKMTLERENDIVIPYSITKNEEKKAGILYLNKDNSIKDAVLFEGENNYVINEVIEAANGNLLVSAEGYSEQGQESLYFLELNEGKIVNDFVFNEDGNELDPFAILEVGENILIGGFIKSRELVSNSFYNMYSETQMIYVGEFTKNGSKIWSKAIDVEGYEKGICNQMINTVGGIVLLCHANKIGEEMSPILISINKKGDIKNIVKLDNNNKNTIGSVLRSYNGDIELYGSFSRGNNYYFYKTIFSESLDLKYSEEYQTPYRLTINGITNTGDVFGAVLIDGRGYNNCILKPFDSKYSFYEFGSDKSDLVFGLNSSIYTYSIASSVDYTSVININSKINERVKLLYKSTSLLKINTDIKFVYQTKFEKSTINKGIDRVKVVDVSDNLN